MNQLRVKAWLVLLFVWAGATTVVQAQAWYHYAPPPSEFDWELFAPITEFDFAEMPASNEGYFFNASRARYWVSRPGRAPLGHSTNAAGQNLVDNPEPAFFPNIVIHGYWNVDDDNEYHSAFVQAIDGGDFGLQVNSVSDAVPESVSGWGNRFEFGWVQSDTIHDSAAKTGWMVSVLTGVDATHTMRLGFDDKRVDQLGAAQGLHGIDAVPGVSNPIPPVEGFEAALYQEGLTTVNVNFEDPFGLLTGFVAFIPGDLDDTIPPPEDLNGDGVITAADLFRLGVAFDDAEIHNRTTLNGVELLAIRRKKKLHGNASAEMFCGARFLEVEDLHHFYGRGGVLADSRWSNVALNRIIGPEVGLQVTRRSRRWSTVLSGRFMAGVNLVNIRQDGYLGDHSASIPLPGIPSRFHGNEIVNRLRDERFSPVGELRLQTSFNVTRGVKLNAGWEGLIAGGVARGANTIRYRMPSLGILDGEEEMFAHGLSFGLEVNR